MTRLVIGAILILLGVAAHPISLGYIVLGAVLCLSSGANGADRGASAEPATRPQQLFSRA
jgi:hypothetical protein